MERPKDRLRGPNEKRPRLGVAPQMAQCMERRSNWIPDWPLLLRHHRRPDPSMICHLGWPSEDPNSQDDSHEPVCQGRSVMVEPREIWIWQPKDVLASVGPAARYRRLGRSTWPRGMPSRHPLGSLKRVVAARRAPLAKMPPDLKRRYGAGLSEQLVAGIEARQVTNVFGMQCNAIDGQGGMELAKNEKCIAAFGVGLLCPGPAAGPGHLGGQSVACAHRCQGGELGKFDVAWPAWLERGIWQLSSPSPAQRAINSTRPRRDGPNRTGTRDGGR